jgi:2-phosphosulfolactate phosphatase
MDIELCFTPSSLSRERLKGRIAVIIDVLRASTTICTGIRNGCRAVIPVASLDDAMTVRENLDRDTVLLCGERSGFKVEGFDLGNSPSEYSEEVVGNRVLIFASTNGSGAIVRASGAQTTLVGGFVNISAVTRQLRYSARDLMIVCAGREGHFSLEDCLCGGMIIERLLVAGAFDAANDAAKAAHSLYKQYGDSLEASVRNADHGRYLQRLGFTADINAATALDTIDVIPVWREGKLVPLDQSG